jgi:hypothetical protein
MTTPEHPTFRVVLHIKGKDVTPVLVHEGNVYNDADGKVPACVTEFLSQSDFRTELGVHADCSVMDVTLSLPTEEFDFVQVDTTHSLTRLEPGQDPLPAFWNTQLKATAWNRIPEEKKRFLTQLCVAAPDLTPKKLLELHAAARPESDCDEDENPVYVKKPKRDDFAFNSELHTRLAEVNHPHFDLSRNDFKQNRFNYKTVHDKQENISVYTVTAKAPGLTSFFLVVDKLSSNKIANTHSLWACAPLPDLEPRVQAERISIMYAATPYPISFRTSYLEPEGKRLSDFADVSAVLGRFNLPAKVHVRDVSGFFDHRPHTERLVHTDSGVTQLLLEWLAMDGEQRKKRVFDLAESRVKSTAARLTKMKEEEEDWDGEIVEVKEASEGEESTPEPSDDDGDDLSESEDEEESDEGEDDGSEDSFIASDDDVSDASDDDDEDC